MSTLFAILFLIFVVLLVWGLVSPKSLSKFGSKEITRKDAGLGFGVLALVFMVLTGITAPKQSIQPTTTTDLTPTLPNNTPQEQPKVDQVEKKTVTETEAISFKETTVNDGDIAKGKTVLVTAGVNGVKTLTYEITLTNGEETDKKLVKTEVTKAPVNQITAIGTYLKPASNCDPNYSGCVPIAYDVDCAGGSGNGPAYVAGPVYVTGSDIYGLDGDHDGIGCE
jgi:resuscitation-promoting factor RpfB